MFSESVTIGGGIHYRVTPSGNMSWLVDEPTAERASRYESIRASRHLAALDLERSELLQLERELSTMFCESGPSRQRRNAKLAEVQSQLGVHCKCEICNGKH